MRWLIGSQCSCFKTGLIWSYFLVLVTTRAAAFWTFCRRSIKNFGSPYRSELALSSLEVMNACTNFSVSARDRQTLILLMFLRWKKQALQVLVTCFSSDMYSSKMTPMFFAEVDGSICSPDTSTWSINGGGRCRALKIKSSVFPLFSFSLLHTIHESISETHASILAIEPGCSA